MNAIDCDIHPGVPNVAALLPYLEPEWRAQVAHGHASRSHGKLHALRCPSCQSISRPLPSVISTRTLSGVTAIRGKGWLCASCCACSSFDAKRMPS